MKSVTTCLFWYFQINRNCLWILNSHYFVYSSVTSIKRITTDKDNLQIVFKAIAAFFQGCFVTVASFLTNPECRYATIFVKNHEKTVSLPVSGVINLECRHLHIYIADNASRTKVFSRPVTLCKINPWFRLQPSGSTPTPQACCLST